MKLLLIRHGDPDYTIDSLTEKGHREAQLLAEKMKNVPVKDFYVSPLGRARATADYTLKKVRKKSYGAGLDGRVSGIFESPGVPGTEKCLWNP